MEKSFSMSQWMTVMKENGIGHVEQLQDAIEQDFTKWDRLKRLNELIGLPIDKHTHFSSDEVLSNSQKVQEFFSQYHKDARFSIKAEPREEFKDVLPRHREHGILQQQCIEFVKNLKPGPSKYVVSIWKYFESQISGIMVVTEKGIIVELVNGKHSILTQGWKGNVVSGFYDFARGVLKINDESLRQTAEKSLDCVKLEENNDIPTYHDFVAGYFEFLYNEQDGFRFIDYNTSATMSRVEHGNHISGLVSGTAASQGSCRGKVCIVRNPEDFSKLTHGDVLVTTMTDPSFVPALGKVAGVITDYGGLTCHAAIITRELGLPCVVGTKNATEKLRDGELVEIRDGQVRRL